MAIMPQMSTRPSNLDYNNKNRTYTVEHSDTYSLAMNRRKHPMKYIPSALKDSNGTDKRS